MVLETTEQLELCILNAINIEVMVAGQLDFTGKHKIVDNEVIEVKDGLKINLDNNVKCGKNVKLVHVLLVRVK